MTFKELMDDFVSVLGADNSEPSDGTGTRIVDFDGNWVVFREDAQAETIVMTTEIGDLPNNGFDFLAQIMLRANFMRQGTGGAVLGIDAESNACCLCRRDSLAPLNGKMYAEIVEAFLNLVEEWQHCLEAFPELAEGIADFKSKEVNEARSLLVGDGMVKA